MQVDKVKGRTMLHLLKGGVKDPAVKATEFFILYFNQKQASEQGNHLKDIPE